MSRKVSGSPPERLVSTSSSTPSRCWRTKSAPKARLMASSVRITWAMAWVGWRRRILPPMAAPTSMETASVSNIISAVSNSLRITSPRPSMRKLSTVPCKSLLEGEQRTATSMESLRLNMCRRDCVTTELIIRSPKSFAAFGWNLVKPPNIEVNTNPTSLLVVTKYEAFRHPHSSRGWRCNG